MTNHERVHKLVAVQRAFMKIKELSNNPAIDELCFKGLEHSVEIGDSLHPELIAEFKRKHADPMA